MSTFGRSRLCKGREQSNHHHLPKDLSTIKRAACFGSSPNFFWMQAICSLAFSRPKPEDTIRWPEVHDLRTWKPAVWPEKISARNPQSPPLAHFWVIFSHLAASKCGTARELHPSSPGKLLSFIVESHSLYVHLWLVDYMAKTIKKPYHRRFSTQNQCQQIPAFSLVHS